MDADDPIFVIPHLFKINKKTDTARQLVNFVDGNRIEPIILERTKAYMLSLSR